MKQIESAKRIVEENPDISSRWFRVVYWLFLSIVTALVFLAVYLHGWAYLLLLPAAYMAMAAGLTEYAFRLAREAGR